MGKPIKPKLHREIENLLRATGLDWSIDPGSRHDIVMLAGERVGTLSHGHKSGCNKNSKKIAATIRQTIKRIEA